MNHAFMDQGSFITVAVALDRHSMDLANAAAAICLRTGKRLCLLHVVEPWAELPQSRPLGAGDPLWDVTQAVERDARDKALGRLEEIATSLPPAVGVTLRVVAGKAVDAIVADVTAHKSCLLLVGARFNNLKFMPRGLSTAMSLMVASPVPVLIIDTTVKMPQFGEDGSRLKVLLADDLGEQSEAAVDFGFALGSALGRVDLRHVHVNGLSLTSLRAGLETAAASAHTAVDALDADGFSNRVYDALVGDLQQRLAERAEAQQEYLEAADGVYGAEIRTGGVYEQLEAAAMAFQPDVMVFGRHHAYHTRPFFVGRVPYRAMLSFGRPLLIVPSAQTV